MCVCLGVCVCVTADISPHGSSNRSAQHCESEGERKRVCVRERVCERGCVCVCVCVSLPTLALMALATSPSSSALVRE